MVLLSFLATLIALINLPTQPWKVIKEVGEKRSLRGISQGAVVFALMADCTLFNYAQHNGYYWVGVISLVGFFFRSFTLMANSYYGYQRGSLGRLGVAVGLVVVLFCGFWIHNIWYNAYIFSTTNIICSSIAMLPQAKVLLNAKEYKGVRSISVVQHILWCCSNALWVSFAILALSPTILIPATLRLSIAFFIVVRYYRLRAMENTAVKEV